MRIFPDHAYKSYLVFYVVAIVLSSPPLIANLLFLKHAHEIDKMATIVRLQQDTHGVYAPALVDNTFRYKLEMIRLKKPDIVALGSSKTMPFQGDAFTTSFVNAGGGMKYLNEGRLFLDQMFQFHAPKIIIMGLDYFWFTAGHPEQFDYPEHDYNEADITRDKLITPFVWLASRKISFHRYMNTVLGRDLSNRYTRYTNIGFMAIETSNGFREDGSRFYGNRYAGEDPNFIDAQFKTTNARFAQRGAEFEMGTDVDPQRFKELTELIALCDRYHVKLVLFLTPTAPSVYQKIREAPADFAYVQKLDQNMRALVQDHQQEYYNFLDLSALGSSDCECVDGTHGGNTAYYRILRAMIHQHPDSILSPFLNLQKLDTMVAQFQGKALALSDPTQINFKETDFLELGCHKR